MRRHGFSSPSPHARDLSVHFNFTLALPNPLSPPFPPPFRLAPFPPHQTTPIVKYVRAHLTNTRCSFVTYVTQDGIWTAFSHPLPLFHVGSGSAPYVSHATSFPSQPLSTFAFLPPSSISTLIRILPKKTTTYLYSALPGYPLTIKKKNAQKEGGKNRKHTSKHSHMYSAPTHTYTPIHDGSTSETQV